MEQAVTEGRQPRESMYAKQKYKPLTRNDFTAGTRIGDGAYGTVFKVQFSGNELEKRVNPSAKNQQQYALKEMLIQRFYNEGRIKEIFIERSILANLDHPSIIKFYQSFKS